MEHFANPRNMGDMDEPSAVGNVGNPACGDMMRLYLKIVDGKIVDAKFKTFGCGAAIASSSMLTEMLKGKTLEEAMKISNQEVVDALGGLPPAKIHCSVMAEEALKAAMEDYEKE
jgi:nitrogen fixation NifU-like protein